MPPIPQKPYWTTKDGKQVKLYLGDVVDVLKRLPSESVHCAVTSPPYWGLRDYGTGEWKGGSAECDHKRGPEIKYDPKSTLVGTTTTQNNSQQPWKGGVCGKCGARRIDQQIGSEPSPDEFVANMVKVFRQVWRVLRNDGTLWLNLGMSYYSGSQLGRSRDISDIELSDCSDDDLSSSHQYDERLDSSSDSNDGIGNRPAPLSNDDASDRNRESTPSVSPSLGNSDLVRQQRNGQSGLSKPDPKKVSPPKFVSPPSAPQSTKRQSSSLPRGVSSPLAKASEPLLQKRTSSVDAPKFERNSACISDTVPPLPPSDRRKLGKAPSSSACQSPECKGLGRCGLCWAKLSIPFLKPGDEVNSPHFVALALQADGWLLRQTICWSKPGPMPESVQNRCTKSHEYIFLLAKRSGYFYDAEAVREKSIDPKSHEGRRPRNDDKFVVHGGEKAATRKGFSKIEEGKTYPTRNKRSVWSVDDHRSLIDWLAVNDPELLNKYLSGLTDKKDTWSVASFGYPGSHFATFPPKLIEPCILAGTSAKGCCGKCGAPWKRVVDKTQLSRECPNDYVKYAETRGIKSGLNNDRKDGGRSNVGGVNSCSNSVAGVEVKTLGWEPTCECNGKFVKRKGNRTILVGQGPSDREKKQITPGKQPCSPRSTLYGPGVHPSAKSTGTQTVEATITEYVPNIPLAGHPIVPCTVLDPFVGSGTSCEVAVLNGRRSIGIDLSETYLKRNAIPRIEDAIRTQPKLLELLPERNITYVRKTLTIGKPIPTKE